MGKAKKKTHVLYPCPPEVNILRELIDMRDDGKVWYTGIITYRIKEVNWWYLFKLINVGISIDHDI